MKTIKPTSVYTYLTENKAMLLHESKTQFASGGMTMHRTVHRLENGKIFVDEQTHARRTQRIGTEEAFKKAYPFIEINEQSRGEWIASQLLRSPKRPRKARGQNAARAYRNL